MSPFVERVVNVLPQEQRTSVTTYFGWMSAFIGPRSLRTTTAFRRTWGPYRGQNERRNENGSQTSQPEMDGALATSARNSSLDLNVFMRSMSSSRPAPVLPPPSPPDSPDNTRRSFHTMLSWFRANSSS